MTRILLVDNYDSFTYNLHHLLAAADGSVPLVIRNDELSLDRVVDLAPEAIVLSPGPGNPAVPSDVGVCADIIAELDIPLLGVCLGYQALVHAAGGSIERVAPVHGQVSRIFHLQDDLFEAIPDGFDAVRYHSLGAVGALPPALQLTAWTADGIPMAVRYEQRRAWGVQFHPESISTAYGHRLVGNFLRLARRASRVPGRIAAATGSQPVLPHTAPVAPRTAPVASPPAAARVHHRRLAGYTEPEDAFVALYGSAATAFWLDSSLAEPGVARYSFLGCLREGGTTLSYDAAEQLVTVRRGDGVEQQRTDIFASLAEHLQRIETGPTGLELPFAGGYVGYLGYEVKLDCGSPTPHRSPLPDAFWMLADRVLAFDHQERAVHAIALQAPDEPDGNTACQQWLDEIELALREVPVAPEPAPPAEPTPELTLRLEVDRAAYLDDIERCLEAIRAGQTYELCLTNRLRTAAISSPLDLYRVLRQVSPAPYAAFLRLGGTAVLCSSPERFLRIDPDRLVSSKPMKGTAPRRPDPAADAAERERLRASIKQRSENLMIVDLLRNDLGRVCDIGTVEVPSLMEVETYRTVHQMVTTVQGRLSPGLHALDCVRAAFPGGSMTGAPKLRSLQILDGLERSARGIYSGALGYLSADGCAELNIVIRTAVTTGEETVIGVGGAIVALSDAESEYEEILLKAQGIRTALRRWHELPRPAVSCATTGDERHVHV